MEDTQQFTGDFCSQHHQFNGNSFGGPVVINTSDPRNRSPGVGEGCGSSLTGDISWESCVQSLAFEGSRFREGVIGRHTDGTCEWLFKSPAYLRWVEEHGLLLIRGNPGCGKSTLLKFALEKQLEGATLTGCLVLSFFLYSSGTELQKGIIGLIRSLLLQLCEQDVSSRLSFHDICRKRWTAEGKQNKCLKWHRNELRVIFERLVLDCSTRRKTTIFIDAVDECDDQDRELLISLLHRLKGGTQIRMDRPRVFLTCRLYPDGQIDEDFIIRFEEKSQHDIQNFIEQELRLPDETESAVNRLKHILQNKAGGIFLWLSLVIQQVHDMSGKGLNLRLIESEILKSPPELDGLYENLIKKIDQTELLEARILFQWICFTRRPLSLGELRTAMTVHLSGTKGSLVEYENEDNQKYIMNDSKMKKRIIHLSRGLIHIESLGPTPVVGFFHETSKNFILSKGLQYLNSRFSDAQSLTETSHLQLANTCIDYLSTKEIHIAFSEAWRDFPTRFSFLEYAAANWLSHAVEAERTGSGDYVRWPSQDTLDTWVPICSIPGLKPIRCPAEGTSLMHIAAKHGLEGLAKRIYSRSSQEDQNCISNAQDKRGSIPLHLAAHYGHTRMTRLLHEHGSAVSIVDRGGLTPLYCASLNGHLEVVKFLYEHGADTDIYTDMGRTPLYSASMNGHLDVIKFLYEHGADADIHRPAMDGWTPIIIASSNGHLEVVKFLCKHGADAGIHMPVKDGWTPLYGASQHGHIDIAEWLLEKGANINAKNDLGCTPLFVASCCGHIKIAELLLEKGANTTAKDNRGWTPLLAASVQGHIEIAELLLKNGADFTIKNDRGWTPLHAASLQGHIEIAELLLNNGADFTIKNDHGWTPLHAASFDGRIDTSKLLLKKGAGIHSKDHQGRTPSQLAVQNGHIELARLLIDSDTESDSYTQ